MWAASAVNQVSPECAKGVHHVSGRFGIPVSLLLDRIITEAGCSRYEFIQALGYRDVYRGLRRLDALEKGEGHPRIIKQIAAAYPAIAQDLKLAIAATSVIKKAETETAWLGWCKAQQESFTPYILTSKAKLRFLGA
jgi:hypothetical protein